MVRGLATGMIVLLWGVEIWLKYTSLARPVYFIVLEIGMVNIPRVETRIIYWLG